MTLALPTRYRREAFRARNQELITTAPDGQEVALKCLRCFREAKQGQRCDDCREERRKGNKGRKR